MFNNVFPLLKDHAHLVEYITVRITLLTTNDNVDILNEKLIKTFPRESKTYYSFDSTVDDTQNYYQEEFLSTLTTNRLPPHLVLKNYCPIKFLRNFDQSNGLYDMTKNVCKGFELNVTSAEITTGQYAGKQVLLLRIPFSPV